MEINFFEKNIESFTLILKDTQVTDDCLNIISIEEGIDKCIHFFRRQTSLFSKKIIAIGNGGSSAICSHITTDFNKNAGLRAIIFNNDSLLTCLSNDYGYEFVFSKQIEYVGTEGDILIAISSSGQSKNIINAVKVAKEKGLYIITFSGFSTDNPLRQLGHMNFYIDSKSYGIVEIGHLFLCHSMIDKHIASLQNELKIKKGEKLNA